MKPTRHLDTDISKALMILLIVFGHFIERLADWNAAWKTPLLNLLYLIHIPTFVFLSGYFFKPQHTFAKIKTLLKLYLVFQLIYTIYQTIVFTPPNYLNTQDIPYQILDFLFYPYWIMWYLLSLILWYALTPLLCRTRFALPIAVLAAVGVAWLPWNTYWFSLGRTLCFLPFFLLGHQYGKHIFTVLRQPARAWHAPVLLMLILGVLMAFCLNANLPIQFIYGSFAFWQLGFDNMGGSVVRLLVLVFSLMGVAAALQTGIILAQWRISGVLAWLGQRTLGIYLWHGFVVMAVQVWYPFTHYDGVSLLFSLFATIISAWLLSRFWLQGLVYQISFNRNALKNRQPE